MRSAAVTFVALSILGLVGCGGSTGNIGVGQASDTGVEVGGASDTGTYSGGDGGVIVVVDVGGQDAGEPPSDTSEPDGDEVDAAAPDVAMEDVHVPVWGACLIAAVDPSPQMVDTWRGTVSRVVFVVQGLPSGVEAATLRYVGYDVDHPGMEGWIEVNGGAGLVLPADAALDNAERAFEVDVSGHTVAGRNTVAFVAFDTPEGSFYRISDVALEVFGFDLPCVGVGGPTGMGVERVMGYREATWDRRNNWVLDCRDYAYTAKSAEHTACDGRYAPDGSARGLATFTFVAVIPDRYEVQVEGRHTTNRNPAGMLVRVDGAGERRIPQRDDLGMRWDTFGQADLGGDVRVIIDSSREDGSDAVRRVRLIPTRP